MSIAADSTSPGNGATPMPPAKRRVSLALQGGGTHGAFTWGVLEALLADGRLEVASVSGTSAGAINGALLAQGLATGGPAAAIESLRRFWTDIAARLAFSPLRNSPLEKVIWGYDLTFSLAWQTFDALTRIFSPYQFNPLPFEYNPLREALVDALDLDALRSPKAPRLHVSTTNVRTGRPKVFSGEDVSIDALLASACLPNLFRAVEIDGEAFWDGGYVGNPALWPLYDQDSPSDIILVQVNPLGREELPTTASDILTRLNEITFNASLMNEMRAVDFVQRLYDAGAVSGPRYKRVFLHLIEDEEMMRRYGTSTKYNGDWDFLCTLRQHGREAAAAWLATNIDAVGERSTLNIRARFLGF